MTRQQLLEIVLAVLDYGGVLDHQNEPQFLLTPEPGTVVIHIDRPRLTVAAVDGLLETLRREAPLGMRYVVSRGPLVPGAWVGWQRLEDADDVPLYSLPRSVFDDLGVSLDHRERDAADPVMLEAFKDWQVLLACERDRRGTEGEPSWTWQGLQVFDDHGAVRPMDEAGIATLRARAMSRHRKLEHPANVDGCAVCAAIPPDRVTITRHRPPPTGIQASGRGRNR